MKRSYLKVGDKSSANGTVTEGIPDVKDYDIELTFLGAAVSCPACKSTGKIGATGPRWPDTFMDKQAGLDGDVCLCKCNPAPVMIASQDTMYEEFDDVPTAATQNDIAAGTPKPASNSDHWIGFNINEAENWAGSHCRAHFADGSVNEGIFQADNTVKFNRPNAVPCEKLEIALSKHNTSSESMAARILKAMGDR